MGEEWETECVKCGVPITWSRQEQESQKTPDPVCAACQEVETGE